jgi:hypothetical protein
MVGLANVDNTSDANKPVSSATQTALDFKANSSDVYTKTEVNTSLGLKANLNNPTFTGTVSGITKNMVGLENVNNTSDANKPVSSATQTALDLKANSSDVYTKTQVDTSLGLKANSADVYTKTQVDTSLGLKANSDDVYTKTQVDTSLNLKANSADVNSSLALKANMFAYAFRFSYNGSTQGTVYSFGRNTITGTNISRTAVGTYNVTGLTIASGAMAFGGTGYTITGNRVATSFPTGSQLNIFLYNSSNTLVDGDVCVFTIP